MFYPLTDFLSCSAAECDMFIGQPVLIGGTMGTFSYVLTGTQQGMKETFATTCHGAVCFVRVLFNSLMVKITWIILVSLTGWFTHYIFIHDFGEHANVFDCRPGLQGRALSRAKSRRNIDFQEVLDRMKAKGISIRVASPKLVMEEVMYRCFLLAFLASATFLKVKDRASLILWVTFRRKTWMPSCKVFTVSKSVWIFWFQLHQNL